MAIVSSLKAMGEGEGSGRAIESRAIQILGGHFCIPSLRLQTIVFLSRSRMSSSVASSNGGSSSSSSNSLSRNGHTEDLRRRPLIWNEAGGSDFNLTALIDSVEKDIRALEDLERGRDGGRLGLPRLPPLPPLPPILSAVELDTLPGYRPTYGKAASDGPIYLHHSLAPPCSPPPLPPKKGKRPPLGQKKIVSNATYGRRPLRPVKTASDDQLFTASLVRSQVKNQDFFLPHWKLP